jgi:membrane associated rhomboid family serine protease
MTETNDPTKTPDPERERFPATIAIATSWVVVYGLMAMAQGRLHAESGNWLSGGILPATSDQFGSLSTAALRDGQFGRILNASFIHFSLIHLVINALVFVQLGRNVEPWYGSGTFLGVYVLLAGLSNALAGAIRPLLGQSVTSQSGGGSGVICGLIALLAVVGWRQRDRFGDKLLTQMAVQLILIGGMGLVIPNVDNLVHACGAVAGLTIGLSDPLLTKLAATRWNWGFGAAAAACLAVAAAAQPLANRDDLLRLQRGEAEIAALDRQRRELILAGLLYRDLAARTRPSSYLDPASAFAEHHRSQAVLTALLARSGKINEQTRALDDQPRAVDWLRLMLVPLRKRPDPGEVSRCLRLQDIVVGQVTDRIRVAQNRQAALLKRKGYQVRPSGPPAPG